MQKFLGQGLNPWYSSNTSHFSDNARYLTHWATSELQDNLWHANPHLFFPTCFLIWSTCSFSILTRNNFLHTYETEAILQVCTKGNTDTWKKKGLRTRISNNSTEWCSVEQPWPTGCTSPGFQKEVRWSDDYGGFGQYWHVSAEWADHIWWGFPSHTLWRSSPVSSSNCCCHPQRLHLLPTAVHYLRSKKKEWAQPHLSLLNNMLCVIKQVWGGWKGNSMPCNIFFFYNIKMRNSKCIYTVLVTI